MKINCKLLWINGIKQIIVGFFVVVKSISEKKQTRLSADEMKLICFHLQPCNSGKWETSLIKVTSNHAVSTCGAISQ